MQPTLIAFRQCQNSWRKMLLGLLTLATLNPPAFLLAQHRPVKFERLGLEQGLSRGVKTALTFYEKIAYISAD
ncbi:hypothetical protein L0337_43020 [candidate division KSB1 bacterium]|nr:hypothetical protein [candidate division KSB1 bacterium]